MRSAGFLAVYSAVTTVTAIVVNLVDHFSETLPEDAVKQGFTTGESNLRFETALRFAAICFAGVRVVLIQTRTTTRLGSERRSSLSNSQVLLLY